MCSPTDPFSTDSDDDDFNPNEMDNNTSDSDRENPPSKRRRWKKSYPENWKKNVSKSNKMSCLPYKTRKGMKEAKKVKPIDCISCKYKCSVYFDNEMRNKLCLEFWKLDYQRQKDFIISSIVSTEPKCRRIRTGTGIKKEKSRSYHFDNKEGTKIRVCKQFFLKTLCISHGPVDTALSGKNEIGIFNQEDKRGHKEPPNKTKPDILAKIKEHIESFPTVDSHYCRSSTTRKYLDSKLSIAKMYSLYVENCKAKLEPYASQITYRRTFCNYYNLSFFTPKKDQCLVCEKYNKTESNDLERDYLEHIRRRDEANSAKNEDKLRAINDTTFASATFDLQSVLQIPSSDVSEMYYSRKLCA